jgi:putative colanic acid biosynthesis acetyltransferase WcaF
MGSSDSQRLDLCKRFPYTFQDYLKRLLWRCTYIFFIRLCPPRFFFWYRFWLRVFGGEIGLAGFSSSATVMHPWLLRIGNRTMVSERVKIYNLGLVEIGNETVISQDVYLCAGTHDYTLPGLPLLRPPIHIGHNVWICAGAFIGPGVTIGEGAVVGARAVVVKDVEPWTVVAGNPAKFIKKRELRLS